MPTEEQIRRKKYLEGNGTIILKKKLDVFNVEKWRMGCSKFRTVKTLIYIYIVYI